MRADLILSQEAYEDCRVLPKTQRAAAGQEGSIENRHISGKTANLICPPNVVSCLTNAIVDGNIIHEEAVKSRGNGEQNFTIPDAIHAYVVGFFDHVQEIDFCSVPGPLNTELPFYIWSVIKR
ncbi:unnamed protein product [Strongylus vulgaris]|uniref:Uncharacterized protein n=1 Tax=Strongylus vulgaris TaxID=40348 RepID=A0A3P7INV6_STRVU|nr:unnamed protein product [Strongylus vulgaris]